MESMEGADGINQWQEVMESAVRKIRLVVLGDKET